MNNNTSNSLSYADAGVDIDAGNDFVDAIKPAISSTARTGSNPSIGGFGGLFDLRETGFDDPVLVAANDGVGTKLMLAIAAEKHDTVGIDLVAMCVNDLVVQGAEPLFFLDYLATGKLDVEQARSVVEGIATGCRIAGCALIGGETAEMPGMYTAEEYDLAGFSVGAVERDHILPRQDIVEGDVLLGLASNGIHSNGFSLVRKILDQEDIDPVQPAPFEHEYPQTTPFYEILLEPTRIYVKPLLKALKTVGGIKALAHITGGGLTENLPRVLPDSLAAGIDLSAISVNPVFGWLSRKGGVVEEEMLRTFNCGIGMVAVVSEADAPVAMKLLIEEGEKVSVIGEITGRKQEPVSYRGKLAI